MSLIFSVTPAGFHLDVGAGWVQVGGSMTVDNGVAYTACVCDGPEVEGQDKCAFHAQDERTATVTCDSGYTLQAWSRRIVLTAGYPTLWSPRLQQFVKLWLCWTFLVLENAVLRCSCGSIAD